MEALIAAEFPDLTGIARLGVGGNKWVYTVIHPQAGENVLKIIDPKSDLERINREILASQQVQSARIPSILETGKMQMPFGECVWIREEKIQGSSLRDHLRQNGPLSATSTLRLLYQILEALSEAEKVSIVHRDIKPDNIMIDQQGDFWLLDFGIARHLLMDTLTATAAPMGACTPGYAPPEQFQNLRDNIDSRTDLFALGVTVYESATGIHPFRFNATSQQEIFRNTLLKAVPPLVLPIKESVSFRDLIAALVGKRRDQRPRTVVKALAWATGILSAQ